jgi:hypothetical protein
MGIAPGDRSAAMRPVREFSSTPSLVVSGTGAKGLTHLAEILLIDEAPVVRTVLAKFISREGHVVTHREAADRAPHATAAPGHRQPIVHPERDARKMKTSPDLTSSVADGGVDASFCQRYGIDKTHT